MRVLLVEDSKHLQKPVVKGLKAAGYAVDATTNGDEGLWMAQTYEYDVIVLDIMLPGIDGLTVLQTLRAEGKRTPVLILSAKDTVDDRVKGLRTGADDYLIKPFALDELLARVETLSRRVYDQATSKLQIADLELDTATKKVTRGGQLLDLAPKQFALLEYLMKRSGQVVSRTMIEEHIYDASTQVMSNVIDSAVSSLRKAISTGPDCKPLIHTRRGHGYVLEER